jgi:hypothetical protein
MKILLLTIGLLIACYLPALADTCPGCMPVAPEPEPPPPVSGDTCRIVLDDVVCASFFLYFPVLANE